MKNVTEVYFDPTLGGHWLVQPLQWYGRQVEWLFTAPIPPEKSALCEVAARIAAFIALLALVPVAIVVFSPSALVGLGVKCLAAKWQNQPSEEPVNPQPPTPPTPKPVAVPSPVPEPVVAPPPVPELTIPESVISAMRTEVQSLQGSHNAILCLDRRKIETLLRATREFGNKFERYRSDDFAKIFNLFDEIRENAESMQRGLQMWEDYYRISANKNGIIPVPGDGSCWMYVFLRGLQFYNDPEAQKDVALLRQEVADWIETRYQEKNDEIFMGYLTESIRAVYPSLGDDELLQEGNVQRYLQKIREPRGHGGYAEFYALAQKYKARIVVWQATVGQPLRRDVHPEFSHPERSKVIHIVMMPTLDHFNSLLPPEESDEKDSR